MPSLWPLMSQDPAAGTDSNVTALSFRRGRDEGITRKLDSLTRREVESQNFKQLLRRQGQLGWEREAGQAEDGWARGEKKTDGCDGFEVTVDEGKETEAGVN
ncbi:unnamed protein product [Pleuronectes platessa]|uniref:Uncharacterized protein n=1 Tax=Pleuronectes platessa TaxID=8262 RepID=A0A9N7YI17_PLEPL|nr:unnamed protein product [Pleuronectes platessa]